ncbi:hypothetical protein SAMN04488527_101562 [Aliiroseovarius crassostreae]|uniref:Uncharacterized protein n=1 Tax=Aliiroseovarius crassostreae TaxID=154981 RepID=A0A0P7KQ19_9RHOB|nr:hypothetical protein [Aliiroseovarius crassostreae]KPN64520.1 hypothetical protein AKJ29_18125 [Aliiroseovarius crassostreae]SFU36616.1 hypothetical protein SAMN04488527_101562 [Aliiroseovarius crassostreae]
MSLNSWLLLDASGGSIWSKKKGRASHTDNGLAAPARSGVDGEAAFSLGGHRLSSLYRPPKLAVLG